MKPQTIEANLSEETVKEKKASIANVVVEVQMPETLREAISVWTEDICFKRLLAAAVIDVQGTLRGAMLKEGATLKSVKDAIRDWKLTARARGKSKAEKFSEQWASLPPEEKKRLLKEFAKTA